MRFYGIERLFELSQIPNLRDKLIQTPGALDALLSAIGDKELWGRHGQLLAIGAIGMISFVTDPVQRARKLYVVNAGGIEVLVSVATDRNFEGTVFQQQSLEAMWAIFCAKQVFYRIISILRLKTSRLCPCRQSSNIPSTSIPMADGRRGPGPPQFHGRRICRDPRPPQRRDPAARAPERRGPPPRPCPLRHRRGRGRPRLRPGPASPGPGGGGGGRTQTAPAARSRRPGGGGGGHGRSAGGGGGVRVRRTGSFARSRAQKFVVRACTHRPPARPLARAPRSPIWRRFFSFLALERDPESGA